MMLVRVLALLALPRIAYAHAIDARHELPVPLMHFMIGAVSAVAVSFVIAAIWMCRSPATPSFEGRRIHVGALLPALRRIVAGVSLLLFSATLAAALLGTRDPMMNLAPTMLWVVWWVGLSLVVAFIGNIWPVVDPWRAIFEAVDAVVRGLGKRNGIGLAWRYPRALGAWPAVFLLLLFGWLEVGYPESAEPRRIAQGLIVWTAITLLGRIVFGREAWERNGDVFSIYFATLGRFAPFMQADNQRTMVVRPPGRGLLESAPSMAIVAFVVAMLAIVLFDGLLSGETWWSMQAGVTRALPWLSHPRGYLVTPLGLAALWTVFMTVYAMSCWAAARLSGAASVVMLMVAFAYTLVPIAIGYSIAHNSSNLLIQGQQAIALVSDPLSLRWNLLGTARYQPYTRVIEAAGSWYVAVAAIVVGHAIAVWLAHRVALRTFGSVRRAVIATLPLTAAMLVYTAISLAVLAEPMVKFEGVPAETQLD
jgi:hypothetical protein